MSSCLPGNDVADKYERFRAFAGSLLGNPRLDFSREVCSCETETAHKNRAIAYMLLDSGVYDTGTLTSTWSFITGAVPFWSTPRKSAGSALSWQQTALTLSRKSS